MTHTVLVALGALVGGLVVGPFVVHAVVRWTGWRVAVPLVLGRVPAAAEVGNPPGRCRRCGAALAPGDLPAIVGLAVGGRCRRCGEPLAGGYLAMEAACALGWAAATAAVGWSAVLVPVLALVTGLIAMCAVDLAVMRIPTRFVYVTAAAVLAGAALVAVLDGPARRLAGAGVGALALGGFLLVLHLVSPRALGFGDVRLGILVGAAAGWSAWRPDHPVLMPVQGVLNAGLLAGLVGSVVGLTLLVVRRRDRPFPFGPALALGGLVVTLATAGAPL
jgi:prepilin signal peptidase PulO-like enzyme (type II secretory pathway)